MLKIGINGFGRIGRCLVRAYANLPSNKKSELALIAINSNGITPEDAAHLLQYDSTHGTFIKEVQYGSNWIGWQDENGELEKIEVVGHSAIEDLNWYKYGISAKQKIDLVMECTGAFNHKDKVEKHITLAGAQKVIVSAPCGNADLTLVLGANQELFDYKRHHVISIGSCTTNCLAPLAKALDDSIGIESGFMTTIHSYTNDQQLLDNRHKDKRRARAAALSMIPTSTGAASALGEVLPALKGKLDGAAVRVPTPNVSMIDFKGLSRLDTSVDEINAIVYKAAQLYPDVIAVNNKELVSIDFNGSPYSAIFDTTQTKLVHRKFFRVVAWYDNEWGFVHRMLEVALILAKASPMSS